MTEITMKTPYQTFEDTINDFVGKDSTIKRFDGNRLRYRLRGMKNVYAYYQSQNKSFGYNDSRMKDVDEANIINIAIHEAGHYWTIDRNLLLAGHSVMLYSVLLIMVGFTYLALLIICLSQLAVFKFARDAEIMAEDFVRETIGPGLTLNGMMFLIFDVDDGPKISSRIAEEIKKSIKELEIDVDIT
jgi:hypothetical protein